MYDNITIELDNGTMATIDFHWSWNSAEPDVGIFEGFYIIHVEQVNGQPNNMALTDNEHDIITDYLNEVMH